MSRDSFRRVAVAALAVAALGVDAGTAGGPAQHVDGPGVGARDVAAQAATVDPSGLSWYGGPVQHHPRIYTIFWGAGWHNDTLKMHAAVNGTIRNLKGSSWNRSLVHYTDATGQVNDDVQLAGTWTDYSPNTGSYLSEVNKAIAKFHWRPSRNTQFMLINDPGTPIANGSCAYHVNSSQLRHAVIDVIGNPVTSSCNAPGDPSAKNGLTDSVTHEYVEAASNPRGNAWHTASGDENADLCQYSPGIKVKGHLAARYWTLVGQRCNGPALG